MLKIRDDVELKELEKFGFEKKKKYYRFENVAVEIATKDVLIQAVDCNQYGDRKIINGKNSTLMYINPKIYDLIKAGLIKTDGESMTNRQWLLEKMQNMSDEEFNQMEFQKLKNEEMGCGRKNCVYRDCDKCELDWLKSEHKEPIKLSDAERVILENVPEDFTYIARDKDDTLIIAKGKIVKGKYNWGWRTGTYIETKVFSVFNHLFQFIKWEDIEPYNIEELLVKGK